MHATVLIADEDVNAQIIAATLLQTRGLGVRVVSDGSEVCDVVRREGIAVVVLDLSLPGMNGFEVLRRLSGRFATPRPSARPRVVVTSERVEPEVERFVLRLGADAFLRKPIAPDRLITTVEQLATAAVPASAVGSLRHGEL